MEKIVVKFGGSNLKTKEDIQKIIRAVRCYDVPIVIVVSALYGVTELLTKNVAKVKEDRNLIYQLKESLRKTKHDIIEQYVNDPQHKSIIIGRLETCLDELERYLMGVHYLGHVADFAEDLILSFGERLSSLLLTSIFQYVGLDCEEVLPEDMGLITNGEFGNAKIDFSLAEDKVNKRLADSKIYIVPGFYGISKNGQVTLLGRGGTDYTAAAIARCIHASSLDIWKDVYGFQSADPKLVDQTVGITQLTYREAAELAYFGAGILHPLTVEPVMNHKIPIKIFNINDFIDTLIPLTVINEKRVIQDSVIKSVTYDDDIAVLKLKGPGVGIKPGILARITTALDNAGINIKSVITSQTSINFLLSIDDLKKSCQCVQNLGLAVIKEVEPVDQISLVAVVGEGIAEIPGLAAQVFNAVSNEGINLQIISLGSSAIATYFIIDRNDRDSAINAIHEEFFCRESVHIYADDLI